MSTEQLEVIFPRVREGLEPQRRTGGPVHTRQRRGGATLAQTRVDGRHPPQVRGVLARRRGQVHQLRRRGGGGLAHAAPEETLACTVVVRTWMGWVGEVCAE